MISFKHTIDSTHNTISNHQDLSDLSESIRNIHLRQDPSKIIFVWTGFGSEISNNLFENSNWQENFVGLFSNQEMWPWKFKLSRGESDRQGNHDLMHFLGSPSQEILASLRIRNFESDDRFQGSLEWFDEVVPYLDDTYTESKLLITNMIQQIRAAKAVGINIFLEKISIMRSFDPSNSITLTPHLHRDGDYGQLESSLVSFYSERITPHSSTLFFPDFDFEAAAHLKPITAATIEREFPNTSAYSLAPGNLAIFSGKRGNDGSKSDERGALHMSPEGFFPTSRLVLLFRSKIS